MVALEDYTTAGRLTLNLFVGSLVDLLFIFIAVGSADIVLPSVPAEDKLDASDCSTESLLAPSTTIDATYGRCLKLGKRCRKRTRDKSEEFLEV